MQKSLMKAVAKTSNELLFPVISLCKSTPLFLFPADEMAKEALAKYKREEQKRKKIYNELQDLRGNIRVFCRVRPLSQEERENGEVSIISFPEEDTLVINNPKSGLKQFEFDRVFSPETTQGAAHPPPLFPFSPFLTPFFAFQKWSSETRNR